MALIHFQKSVAIKSSLYYAWTILFNWALNWNFKHGIYQQLSASPISLWVLTNNHQDQEDHEHKWTSTTQWSWYDLLLHNWRGILSSLSLIHPTHSFFQNSLDFYTSRSFYVHIPVKFVQKKFVCRFNCLTTIISDVINESTMSLNFSKSMFCFSAFTFSTLFKLSLSKNPILIGHTVMAFWILCIPDTLKTIIWGKQVSGLNFFLKTSPLDRGKISLTYSPLHCVWTYLEPYPKVSFCETHFGWLLHINTCTHVCPTK